MFQLQPLQHATLDFRKDESYRTKILVLRLFGDVC